MDIYKIPNSPNSIQLLFRLLFDENLYTELYTFDLLDKQDTNKLIKLLSEKPLVWKNPSDAVTPDIGVGCVFPETGTAITYPNSSSGPFQYCGLFVYPEVGVPIDKFPTCCVPGIDSPRLYAKDVVVDIFVFNYK